VDRPQHIDHLVDRLGLDPALREARDDAALRRFWAECTDPVALIALRSQTEDRRALVRAVAACARTTLPFVKAAEPNPTQTPRSSAPTDRASERAASMAIASVTLKAHVGDFVPSGQLRA
jgi:hypothetical protein